MRSTKFVCMSAMVLLCATIMVAQNAPETTIKNVPISSTSAASGQEMYKAYCAVCHGTDGKGSGPAATALKAVPTDLTTLARNNGGKFPQMKVASTIEGKSNLAAHGTQEMPVWGQLFWSMSNGHGSEVQQRVSNLTKYIESLQVK